MGDNNEQEAADLDAIHNDGDNLFEVIFRGGRLDNNYDDDDDDDENPRPPGVPDYIIPDGVLIRLTVDLSVTKIDTAACCDCRMLREVMFHNNVTEIGYRAFQYCINLLRIELPAGLLRVEAFAFDGCTSLRGEIIIPASVQFIDDFALCGCESLESAVFMPTTTRIELGMYMFKLCTNLRFVTLPQNLQSIPAFFFEDCSSLTHLLIPVSVMEIGGGAFRGSGLRSVTISENVHQIDWEAFKDCAFLERVTIHSTDLTMDNGILVNCPLLSVIMIAPWLWPTLFASMNEHPEFIFQFFRHYPTQILDGSGGG